MSARDEYLDDLAALLQAIREAELGRPIFLVGHTGSGPIALEYAMRRPSEVRGVCCISPVLKVAALPLGVRLLAGALSVIAPRLTLDVTHQADKSWNLISHDAAFNQFARTDPLRNTKVTPRWLMENGAAMRRVSAQAASFPIPLLILLGGDDQVTPRQASRDFYEAMKLPDKEFHEYPGAYVNLLSDTMTDQVLSDLDAWLDRHTDDSPA